MTAPERIWLQDGGDFDAASEVTWCQHSIDDADTEYVRADLAAVQPAQVRVKPLVWGWNESLQGWRADCQLTRDVFCVYETNTGWVASSETTGSTIHANADAAKYALDGNRAARILAAIEPQPDPRDEVIKGLGPIADLLPDAVAAAEKAMRKYPQPNYVISKWAEETGEVTKDLIHMAEGRQTVEKLRGEIVQSLAMLHRLLVEGDQVHGLPPISAALAAAKAVQHG